MMKLFKQNQWSKGPGIQLDFYLSNQKIESVRLLPLENAGIKSEIWSKENDTEVFALIEAWINDYANKISPAFTLPISWDRFSPFTTAVLLYLERMPFGKIITYQGVATALGAERAARAVGSACRKNPCPLIIPCHRVIHTGKKATRYSAGGAEMKKKLLDYEGVIDFFMF